jgi:hypothetical protein
MVKSGVPTLRLAVAGESSEVESVESICVELMWAMAEFV